MISLGFNLSEAWDMVLLYFVALQTAPLDVAIVLANFSLAMVAWADVGVMVHRNTISRNTT
jgi:hypothetical protein